MRRYILTLYGLPFIMLMWSLLLPGPAEAQLIQHGPKLVGTGAAGAASQGTSVVLSGDGNTAVVGGVGDNANTGAAWVYIRSDGVWNQQAKLVGSGAVGGSFQGFSVSLSSDGNTAIVGGISDNGSSGAAWVYTRSGSVWSQQGPKLVGTGAVGPRPAIQGFSVSLSDNGNTAIVGGPYDNSSAGAAWVYTRSDGVWSQQAKLVGTGALSLAEQGHAVSLSGDGNTAIVGGFADNSSVGAAWVYTRSDGVWSQQAKLVGAGASTPAAQGISVSLSGDGNTAIVGGPSGPSGAAWVYTRSGGVWSQQAMLVGTGAVGGASHGFSVSLSDNGNTAIVGGPYDNSFAGAAWVYTRSDGVWSQQAKLVGTGAVGLQPAQQGYSVSLSGDGNTAIVGGPADSGVHGFADLAGLRSDGSVGAAWVYVQPVFAGTPGKPNCHRYTIAALARQYSGLNRRALQKAIIAYCEPEHQKREPAAFTPRDFFDSVGNAIRRYLR